MKKIVIYCISMFLFVAVYAQDDLSKSKTEGSQKEFKTVFGGKKEGCKIPLGYFIDINAAYTMFGSYSVFLPGISAGVILDHHWTLGLTGYFMGNPHGLRYDSVYYDTVGRPRKPAYLRGGYGGLLFEYTLMPNSVVHVSFPLMIGVGYMYFRNTDSYNNNQNHNQNWNQDWNSHKIADTYCFVIEPGVRLEFNLVKLLRMGVTLSYRYSPNLDLTGVPASELNQFNARLSFRLGKF